MRACRWGSSDLAPVNSWIVFAVDDQYGAHECMTLLGEAPTTTAWNFGDQTVDVQSLEQSRYSGALAGAFPLSSCWLEETASNVLIAKAVDGVLAAHGSGEESDVVRSGRVEAPVGAVVLANRPSQGREAMPGLSGILDRSQGIEIPTVGGQRDLGVTREVADPFGHWIPAHHLLAVTDAASPDLELIGTIDNGLHTQYAPVLVVHFNTVVLHPMANASARPAFSVVIANLAGEVPVELPTEEGHYVLGAEAVRGMLQQVFIQARQSSGTSEHQVGGQFGLFGDPVIVHAFEQVLHQWIDSASQGSQRAGPLLLGEAVGQTLGSPGIVDPAEGVVLFPVGDAALVHLAGEPVVSVEANLSGEREPGRNPHMHEAKFAIDEIEVETEAFAAGRDDLRAALPVGDLEALAGLNGREDADQPLGDLVTLGDGPDTLFLSNRAGQVEIRPCGSVGHGLGVLLDQLGLPGYESAEVLDPQALAGYELLHGLGPSQGQMAFEENPVEARNGAGDLGLMLVDESFHGVLRSMVG